MVRRPRGRPALPASALTLPPRRRGASPGSARAGQAPGAEAQPPATDSSAAPVKLPPAASLHVPPTPAAAYLVLVPPAPAPVGHMRAGGWTRRAPMYARAPRAARRCAPAQPVPAALPGGPGVRAAAATAPRNDPDAFDKLAARAQASRSHLRVYPADGVRAGDRTTLQKLFLEDALDFAAPFATPEGPALACLSMSGKITARPGAPPRRARPAALALSGRPGAPGLPMRAG